MRYLLPYFLVVLTTLAQPDPDLTIAQYNTDNVTQTGVIKIRIQSDSPLERDTVVTIAIDGVNVWGPNRHLLDVVVRGSRVIRRETDATTFYITPRSNDLFKQREDMTIDLIKGNSYTLGNPSSLNIEFIEDAPSLVAPVLSMSSTIAGRVDLTFTDPNINEEAIEIWLGQLEGSLPLIDSLTENSTGYSRSGLSEGATYYGAVRAVRSGEDGPYSNTNSVVVFSSPLPLAPDSPNNFRASIIENITMTSAWDAADDTHTGFKMYLDGNPVGDVAPDLRTFQYTGLVPATAYTIGIAATNSVGSSVIISSIHTTTVDMDDPSGLSATALNDTQMNLSWNDNAVDETHYRVDTSLDNFQTTQSTLEVPNNSVGTTVSGLDPDTLYYFRVRAYHAGSDTYSGFSGIASDKTTPSETPGQTPEIPGNVKAFSLGNDEILIAWDVAPFATPYDVEWGVVGSANKQIITAIDTNQRVLTGLNPDTTYEARVRGVAGTLQSDWSPNSQASTSGVFELTATVDNNSVRLALPTDPNAVAYHWERKSLFNDSFHNLNCTTSNTYTNSDWGARLAGYMYDDPVAGPSNDMWDEYIALGAGKISFLVANDASGPTEGGVADPLYTQVIDDVHAVGGFVLGYVPTEWGSYPDSVVLGDITEWYNLYPEIDGVFIDECGMGNNANEMTGSTVSNGRFTTQAQTLDYYNMLLAHLRAIDADGVMQLNRSNTPLTHWTGEYLDVSNPMAIMENTGAVALDQVRPPHMDNYSMFNYIAIVHSTVADDWEVVMDHMKFNVGVGHLFLTDLSGSGRYGDAPTYLSDTADRITAMPNNTSLTYRAKVEYDDGTFSNYSNEITVFTGNPPANSLPTISLTSPSPSAVYNEGDTIPIVSSVSDTDGQVVQVDFYYDDTYIGPDHGTAPFTFTWNNVPAIGNVDITAIAIDNDNGRTTSAPINITVNGTTPLPNTPPTVSISAPADLSVHTAGDDITVTATASDSDGFVEQVDFYQGGQLIGSAPTSPFSIVWADVPAGVYTLTAEATDDDQAMTLSSAITITVNATDPTPGPTPGNPDFTVPDDFSLVQLFNGTSGASNIQPGHQIMVKDGTYQVDQSLQWDHASGTESQRIRVYSESRLGAKIRSTGGHSHALVEFIRGTEYVDFEHFDVGYNNQDRYSNENGPNPPLSELPQKVCILTESKYVRIIGCYTHDGKGGFTIRTPNNELGHGNEFWGCFTMNNGWRTPAKDEGVQCYFQPRGRNSQEYSRMIASHIMQGYHIEIGMQIFGGAEAAPIQGMVLEDNAFVKRQTQLGGSGNGGTFFMRHNLFAGSVRWGYWTARRNGDLMEDCVIFHERDDSIGRPWASVPALTTQRLESFTARRNSIIRRNGTGRTLVVQDPQGDRFDHVFEDNDWYEGTTFDTPGGSSFGAYQAYYSANTDTFSSTYSGAWTRFSVNPYIQKDARYIHFDESEPTNITISSTDLNRILDVGDTYYIMSSFNLEGGVIATGTYNGTGITLPFLNKPRTSPIQNNASAAWDTGLAPDFLGLYWIWGVTP